MNVFYIKQFPITSTVSIVNRHVTVIAVKGKTNSGQQVAILRVRFKYFNILEIIQLFWDGTYVHVKIFI